MKSSKRGTRTLSLVSNPISQESTKDGALTEIGLMEQGTSLPGATIQTAPSQQKVSNYGWKSEYARMQASFDPYETWLLTQAKSYLGRDVTVEDAKELFSRIDPSTRKPRETPTAPRTAGLLAALRALVAGGMILLVSGCSNEVSSLPTVGTSVRKVYDKEEGVVCYVYTDRGISCMVAKPGDGQ